MKPTKDEIEEAVKRFQAELNDPRVKAAIESAIAPERSTYRPEEDEEFISDEDRANAHLIAAAPELLEALDLITEWWDDTSGAIEDVRMTDYTNRARAAIKKARGETP